MVFSVLILELGESSKEQIEMDVCDFLYTRSVSLVKLN